MPKSKYKRAGYRFRREGNDTFTILDVPIMAEVPEGEKANLRHVGRKWMQLAVDKATKRMAEDGYKAPLHIDHHGDGKTEAAGFIIPHSVRQMSYEGDPVWAIFADLEVKAEVFDEIQKESLPYRSVEIFDWGKPEINSLALLSDEVPYFRFDILRLGEEVEPITNFSTGPVMASRSFALGSAVLFNFKKGSTMANEETDLGTEGAAEKFESRAERADVDRYEYEEGKKEGEEEEMSAKLEERGDEFFDSMFDLLRKIAEKMGIDSEEEAEAVEEVQVAETVEAPVEQAALAALQGKISALENRERARIETERNESLVEQSMSTLAAWSPDDQARQNLTALIGQSNDPEKTAATFVASYKSSVPVRPAGTLEDFDAMMGAKADHPEILKFAEQGPDALDGARRASIQFDELAERGMVSATREDFIKTQLLAESGEIVRR